MAQKAARKGDEAPTQSIGEWIVTFSDCMTLLLCFFVLLLTFSSFDEAALQRFDGVFDFDPGETSARDRNKPMDSMVPEPEDVMDLARKGSETSTNSNVGDPHNRPDSNWIADADAYRDRRVIHIESNKLFAAGMADLTPDGKDYLRKIAAHMRQIPSRVIISESSGQHIPTGMRRTVRHKSLERSWVIMAHFTDQEGLPAERFNISAGQLTSSQAVVEIVLLARRVYQ